MPIDRPSPEPNNNPVSAPETRVEQIAEVHKEDIKRIEQLKIGDDGRQRAQIILVLLGKQPAVDIFLDPQDGSPEEIIAVLKQAGLSVRQQEHVNNKGRKSTVLFVARTPETADDLMRTHPSKGPRTEHEAYAQLMGFPQTAIDAFLQRIPRLPRDEQNTTLDSDLIMQMIYSKDHWKDEIEFLRERSRIIKQYAPELYEEIMEADRAAENKKTTG